MRTSRMLPAMVLVPALLTVALRYAGAQTVEVPDFVVAVPTFEEHIQDFDVAVGSDGTIVFIWDEYRPGSGVAATVAVTRRFAADGTPLGPPIRVDTSKHVAGPEIAPDGRGGFVAAWPWIQSGQDYAFFGQRLDGTGRALGSDFQVDFADGGATNTGAGTGLPSGSVFVWKQLNQFWGRLYDTTGAPRGAPFSIAPSSPDFDREDVAVLPDGGFVAIWSNSYIDTHSWARVYDAAGTPRGEAFPIGTDLYVRRVAVSPLGPLVAAGTRASTDTVEPWIVRFTTDGTVLGEHRLEVPNSGVVPEPDIAIDTQGKIYVAWSEYQSVEGRLMRPRARGLDPNGTPVAPGFWVTTAEVSKVRTAVLPDGRFLNTWVTFNALHANIVSIPPPGSVVCGDGIVAAGFEECDDGAANSDSAPSACRTNCLRARCGDRVVDDGESCDDGNVTSCDGCSASCTIEQGTGCGDGILAPGCEQCDDANGDDGDGCDGACRFERIPGGGSATTDCILEWIVDNPSNAPRFDNRGSISAEQSCADGDAACDNDVATGTCTFAVRLCARARDGRCDAAPLAGVTVKSPTANQAARAPEYAAIRAAIAAAAAPLIGATARDVCSDPVGVTVPLRGSDGVYRSGKVKVKTIATGADGLVDKDTLRLICMPPH